MKTDTMPSFVKQKLEFDTAALPIGAPVKVSGGIECVGLIAWCTPKCLEIVTVSEDGCNDNWYHEDANINFGRVTLEPEDVALESGIYHLEVLTFGTHDKNSNRA